MPDELVESAGDHGMRTDWLQLPHPCGRAGPAGAAGPAVSGVYATHETAHPFCAVKEHEDPSLPAHPHASPRSDSSEASTRPPRDETLSKRRPAGT